MRVYVGVTTGRLRAARDAGVVGPAPLPGYAVTPALRESYAEGDQEELEYVALTAAAQSCLPLLAADPAQPRRRVVLACDVADAAVTRDPEPGPAGVIVTTDVAWRYVAAIHADDAAAAPAVAAAAEAYDAALRGDDDARFTLDEAEGWELLWFATQEADDLLAP